MYTGTLIEELMAAVELAEQSVERERLADEQELRTIFAMQIPLTQGDKVLVGAA